MTGRRAGALDTALRSQAHWNGMHMGRATTMLLGVTMALSAGACSSAAPSTSSQPAPWVRVLSTSATADTFAVPTGVAQVELRLPGDLPAPDTLVAEVSPKNAPGDAKRWPVDAATAAADGARVSVTLPVYALTPGDYVVTVWQGDADALQRYAFHVMP